MALQITEPVCIFEDFLSTDELEKIFSDIKNIEDKFEISVNNYWDLHRIYINNFFTDNPIQLLIKNKIDKLGYNIKDLEIQITSYNNFQKYDWHEDTCNNRAYNYILYLTGQERFEGGELQIKIDGKIQTLIPKKNTLVIMDSALQHRVLPVKTKISGIWQISRLTLNGHIKH